MKLRQRMHYGKHASKPKVFNSHSCGTRGDFRSPFPSHCATCGQNLSGMAQCKLLQIVNRGDEIGDAGLKNQWKWEWVSVLLLWARR